MAVGLNETAITTTVGSVMNAERARRRRARSITSRGRADTRPTAASRASVRASASMAKAAAPGQLNESSPRSRTTLAIIFTLPPPSSSGVGNADSVHAKTMSPPDTMPGHGQRQRDAPEHARRARAEAGRRALVGGVDVAERGGEDQDHRGHREVDEADEHAALGEQHRHRPA